MTPEQIAERFDISISAARIRAEEIKRLSRRATGKLRPLPPGVEKYLLAQRAKGFVVTRTVLKE
jgi:hypothetical protein